MMPLIAFSMMACLARGADVSGELRQALGNSLSLVQMHAFHELSAASDAYSNHEVKSLSCNDVGSDGSLTLSAGDKSGIFGFKGCAALKSLVLKNGAQVQVGGFSDCPNLKSVVAEKDVKIPTTAFQKCPALETLSLGDKVSFGSNQFKDHASLKTLTLGDKASVGSGSFEGCSALETVTFGNDASVGSNSFKDSSVKVVSFLDGANVGSSSFLDCKRLHTLTMCGDTIGSASFKGCSALENVYLGDNVRSLGSSSFDGCTALSPETFIMTCEKLTTIGSAAFGNVFVPPTALSCIPTQHCGSKHVIGAGNAEACTTVAPALPDVFVGACGVTPTPVPPVATPEPPVATPKPSIATSEPPIASSGTCSRLQCPTGVSSSCSNSCCTLSCGGETKCANLWCPQGLSTSCSNGDCTVDCRGGGNIPTAEGSCDKYTCSSGVSSSGSNGVYTLSCGGETFCSNLYCPEGFSSSCSNGDCTFDCRGGQPCGQLEVFSTPTPSPTPAATPAPVPAATPAPTKGSDIPQCTNCGNRPMECWETCGKTKGYCSACDSLSGRRGACCFKGGPSDPPAPPEDQDPDECSAVDQDQFLYSGYHMCVLTNR